MFYNQNLVLEAPGNINDASHDFQIVNQCDLGCKSVE